MSSTLSSEADLGAAAAARLSEAAVAASMSLPVARLREPGRGRRAVQKARRNAIYLAHVGFGLSLSRTGVCFGRDRTTVRHACAGAEDERDDPRVDLSLAALEAGIFALACGLAERSAR